MYELDKRKFGAFVAQLRKEKGYTQKELSERLLISCEYNFDNCCVELKFTDGSMIAIDTIAVENEVADNMYQRSELDWLIYNKPLEYAQLVFSGNLTKYIKESPEHRLEN